MSFFDKLQFWKKSDDLSSDPFSSDADSSFSGADDSTNQSISDKNFSQGELPPLDSSSQQTGSADFENDPGFMDPNAHASGDNTPTDDNQPQPNQYPQEGQSQAGQPQQNNSDDTVMMSSDEGDRPIGKELADKYINSESRYDVSQNKNQRQATNQPSQQTSNSKKPIEHSLELINIKLDSLKNALDAISQRLIKVENELEKESRRRW
ncbi:MAG: hypothetical protein ACQESC_01430 [Nanobdellota archaeon]